MKFGALILAGGHSSRMGYPKPWLLFEAETTYLERIVDLYSSADIHEIVVVMNAAFCEMEWKQYIDKVIDRIVLIKNDRQDLGRLYSIQLGLGEMEAEFSFIHNVDSPYVSRELIVMMQEQTCEGGVSLPTAGEKNGHPILISAAVKDEICNHYQDHTTLRDLLCLFEKRLVKTDDQGIFTNVNTKADRTKASGGLV